MHSLASGLPTNRERCEQFASSIGKCVDLTTIRADLACSSAGRQVITHAGSVSLRAWMRPLQHVGGRMNGSLLLEDGASESRPAAQGGVEAIERHRRNQEKPCQTNARIPSRPLSRQGKVVQDKVDYAICNQR